MRRHAAFLPLLPALLLAWATPARSEQDFFLSRDETIPAETYLESDGGELDGQPSESAWDTWVEGAAPPPGQFELPGLWPIKRTAPELQTLVVGPTYRNQKNRTEIGAGLAYINSKYRFPFELSIEPTYRRNKRVSGSDRDFARVRTFGLVEAWSRSSDWESTAFAPTIFWDWQSNSFNTLELGGSVTQSFGRRLSISGNLVWSGEWPRGESFHNAAIGSVGSSYNLGAGVRVGGFYEPYNNIAADDDWGGFISWQLLPFAELAVNAGKHEFVSVRLMFSYALERPGAP